MDAKRIISLRDVKFSGEDAKISWDIHLGQHWLLTGDVNSGKSEYLKLITGKSFLFEENVVNYFSGNPEYGFARLNNHITYLNFRGLIADHRQFYYQQRYNSTESDDAATLRNTLFPANGHETDELNKLVRLFGLRHCLDEAIIKLSSGEYRKASIIQAILKDPEVLVLDEPYAGLDSTSTGQLDDLLDYIAKKGTTVILSSNAPHIPPVITNVLTFDGHKVGFCGVLAEYHSPSVKASYETIPFINLTVPTDQSFHSAFRMEDTTVKYDHQVILDHINWDVRKGEKWMLSGRNGAGKSMLLSLVVADNPQVYANKVSLFDRQRGTGESIWEVKDRIGYFSSEMFLYYDKTKTTTSAAFRYLSANPYHKKTASAEDLDFFAELTRYFRVGNFADKPLYTVPYEAQRIFMLINVFLGRAPLIILDEPYHGLDEDTIRKANRLLSLYCASRTLVFVSHNRSEIPEIVEHDFHLKKGKGQSENS